MTTSTDGGGGGMCLQHQHVQDISTICCWMKVDKIDGDIKEKGEKKNRPSVLQSNTKSFGKEIRISYRWE